MTHEKEHTMQPINPEGVEAQRKALNRLKRARGQLNAVIEQVESGASCRDVITQLAAVSSALDRAGFTIISTAMRNCMIAEGPDSDMTPEELEKLFLTLS